MVATKVSTEALKPLKKNSRGCVLVVDDDPKILKFIRVGLTLAGYMVITAASGEEALKFLEAEEPDIIVLDIVMPVMDGFEVLRLARAVSGIPVIAVSARASTAKEALHLGASDFLDKPFRSDELVKRIEVALHHRFN
jgi:DNA-binding response OmpR family regulator